MPAKTSSSKRSSAGSARAFILRTRPSRLLLAWTIAAHVAAAAGILSVALALGWRLLLLAFLAVHAYWRRPRPPELIVRNRTGLWALPESGLTALSLGPGTRAGSWWIELRLTGPGCSQRRLLCRDQVGAESWRLLQLALRCPRRPDLA